MTPDALLEQLLNLRGFSDPVIREEFLNPKYDHMHNPYLMHDMDKAVARILSAIEQSEMICIYSDYDADGIPGAVILHDFFKKINYEHFWNYIPHRHTEGYGLHRDALQKIKEKGTNLLITVDLGITAVDEVVLARELGMDVIITDHHEPLEVIPDALAVVNPKLGNYPDRMLCGAGVAFKLIQALLVTPAKALSSSPAELASLKQASAASERHFASVINPGWEKWLLDMAGIATLSDMVPLVNENRIFAYYGMKVLQKTPRPGLVALFQKSGINLNFLTETDIVFSITPKLNAASRMAHPDDTFKLLASQNRAEGLVAAEHLTSLNDQRKKIVATIMRDVHKKIIARKESQEIPKVLVIGDPTWPAGILGLVASKVVEEYQVTTFVWGSEGDSIKGSCRGIGDVSVVKLMQGTAGLLVQFGGHEEAGGFTTTREQIHFIEAAFNTIYEQVKHEISQQVQTVTYDYELELSDVTMAHYRALRQMAPFGMANPKPIFAFKNIQVQEVRQFGKTKEHLELVLSPKVRAISWYARPDGFTVPVESGKTITLLAEFDHSVFRGKEELRLMIVDVLE